MINFVMVILVMFQYKFSCDIEAQVDATIDPPVGCFRDKATIHHRQAVRQLKLKYVPTRVQIYTNR